jgi:hypothetical protein
VYSLQGRQVYWRDKVHLFDVPDGMTEEKAKVVVTMMNNRIPKLDEGVRVLMANGEGSPLAGNVEHIDYDTGKAVIVLDCYPFSKVTLGLHSLAPIGD